MPQSIVVGEGRTTPERARRAERAAEHRRRFAGAPVVIEARDIQKRFRIPKNRVLSLKERAVHPLTRHEFREISALRDVSFDIHRGEFFGIVGRNGSGKSTLLKILASIYSADSGRIRMAGRPAPFIELGVGFDMELAARDNVALNGVMMGLSRREALRRLDSVLDFAELRDFSDLKVKNYSSGMLVRLAFSVMIHSPATDILLIDEVLAVGDASFQEKCAQAFRGMRRDGRTVVLVTHDMDAVTENCDRAMVIHGGEIGFIGDPDEAAKEYLRLNFQAAKPTHSGGEPVAPGLHARVVEAWLQDERGEPVANLEVAQPIRFSAVLEATDEWIDPSVGVNLFTTNGIHVLGFEQTAREGTRVGRGGRVSFTALMENPLMPGTYLMQCTVSRRRRQGGVSEVQALDALGFVIYGTSDGAGLVAPHAEGWISLEDGSAS
jgi:ABC-2 type transport system ATP-binding protein